ADFRRLTDLKCTDEANKLAVEMKFDSSISPFGPEEFRIYGAQVAAMTMTLEENSTSYAGMAGDLSFEFTGQNKKKYQTTLMIDNSQRKVSCEYKTKFRL
ncbi:MAG: hypothetical protein ACJ76H_03040, partial [Bacteriovoracaceae bacterium]